ncbi:hypothetical protein [Desulfosporosinus sp. I2]|uniref:hypothetical protein n=1 Tax=Desulfosporosinus sp. I2 TaxID=1617025 RepID=UPI000AFA28AC|nr:hypothetical protein [Desulfosporosinus sp. I2]
MDSLESQENYINGIINSLMEFGLGGIAHSIILSGSFGRYEPTYTVVNDEVIYLSDVELVVVVKKVVYLKEARKICERAIRKTGLDINLMPITLERIRNKDNYNFKLSKKQELKTIFTYDLYNGSRTVWGEDYLKSNVSLDDVDKYEMKRLIGNRIGEMLLYLEGKNKMAQNQWKSKLILACVSALLVHLKLYKSSYKEQRNATLKANEEINSIMGTRFLKDYEYAFSFLREGGKEFNADINQLREYVDKISYLFNIEGINTPKSNNTMRKLNQYIKIFKNRRFKLLIMNNIEDYVYSNLINLFCSNNDEGFGYAKIWKQVLY